MSAKCTGCMSTERDKGSSVVPTMMIACAVAKVRLRYALKDTMIMLAPMLAVLAAMIVFPEIVLFLPRLFAPEFLK